MEDAIREALKERLESLDKAGEPFRQFLRHGEETMRPWRQALASLHDAREAVLEAHGVELAGTCERCKQLLFAGELGSKPFADDQGIIYCEPCSPTWGDLADSLPQDATEDDEYDENQAVLRDICIRRQADGTLGEKACLEPLEAEMRVF